MSETKQGFWARLKGGLSKSAASLGQNLTALVTHRKLDEETLEELEETLIAADLGPRLAQTVADDLRSSRFGKDVTDEEIRAALAQAVIKILAPLERPFALDAARPHVALVVGVNGAGKTTSIGKIAQAMKTQGHRVMMAAGDTFRAAAVEQLKVWAERTGAPIVVGPPQGDPAALAYQALERAQAEGADLLLIDTAGRLQNKAGLMDELAKIVRVIKKKDPSAPHSVLLVLDATSGQNALAQAQAFRDICNVTGLVMTKLDGTAKGGVLVAISDKHRLPIHWVGVGEKAEDLQAFNAQAFARALTGLETLK